VYGTLLWGVATIITGKDEISLKILSELEKGTAVKDIPSLYHVSLDQAKRLSRYLHMLKQVKKHLGAIEIQKMKQLGLKALYLSPLFKNYDWEGLSEVLQNTTEHTRRKDLPLLIKALEEKRNRIKETEDNVHSLIENLKKQQQELTNLELDIQYQIKLIRQQTKEISQYPLATYIFLLKHLGIYQNQLVLARRIDSNWQRSLKKKGILVYDEKNYVWLIKNLDAFANDYLKRTNRKKPYPTEWDAELEKKRNSMWGVPSQPQYQLPTGLAEDLQSKLKELELQKKQIHNDFMRIQEELNRIRQTSPQSFLENVEISNHLSEKELLLHGKLQDLAMKWLYKQDYVVASEITLPNGKRIDVAGYNRDKHIVMIEVKVSKADFMRDQKWQSYLSYTDDFYFLLSEDARSAFSYENIGLLFEYRNSLAIAKSFTMENKATEREQVIFEINRVLARKYVYGF